MPRIVSVWLPRWPIRRFLAAPSLPSSAGGKGWGSTLKPVDPERPFVLTVEAAGGPRIAALNEAAAAEGLAVRDLLAHARAKVTTLQVRPAQPAPDDAPLRAPARGAHPYTPPRPPRVAPWGGGHG